MSRRVCHQAAYQVSPAAFVRARAHPVLQPTLRYRLPSLRGSRASMATASLLLQAQSRSLAHPPHPRNSRSTVGCPTRSQAVHPHGEPFSLQLVRRPLAKRTTWRRLCITRTAVGTVQAHPFRACARNMHFVRCLCIWSRLPKRDLLRRLLARTRERCRRRRSQHCLRSRRTLLQRL